MKQDLLACHPCQIPLLQERGMQLVPASVGQEQAHSGKGTVSVSHGFECSGFSWRGLWFCLSFVEDQSCNHLHRKRHLKSLSPTRTQHCHVHL